MKTLNRTSTLTILSVLMGISLAACGGPDDKDGVLIIVEGPAEFAESGSPFTLMDRGESPSNTNINIGDGPPTAPQDTNINTGDVPPTGPEDSSPYTDSQRSVRDRGEALLESNFFLRRLSVASSDNRVIVGADTIEGLVVGVYTSEMSPEAVFEVERAFDSSGDSSCEQSLKVLSHATYLSVIEMSCGVEVEVSVRSLSYTGEAIGHERFSLGRSGHLSVSSHFAGVIILSINQDQVSWYEFERDGGLNRTLTHDLPSEQGDRRLVGVAHHGSQAMLQYSDGLLRRVSYAIRCGTTSDASIWLSYDDNSVSLSQAQFEWDEHRRQYIRYVGRLDGDHQIELIPWNVSPENDQITALTTPSREGEYMTTNLAITADGPRLISNNYSQNQFMISALDDGHVEAHKRHPGDLEQSWSILGGRASLLLFEDRCINHLILVNESTLAPVATRHD